MKILYIITQADGGGAQNYVLTLAKSFQGAVAAGNEAGEMFEQAEQEGIKIIRLKYLKRNIHPFYDVMAIFEIRKLIKNFDPDIVHLNSSKAGFVGSLAGAFLFHPVKIVFTAHGFIFNEPFSPSVKKIYLYLEKFASLFRDHIICVSLNDYNSAIAHHLVKKNKLSTIYNGLDPINFLNKSEARTKLGLPQDKLILGCVANFYKTKGLDVLIKAIAMMSEEVKTKFFTVIIGGGPEEQNISAKIQEYKLENCITLQGKIKGANTYLKAFDFFVLPSRKEGFPFVLLEAMQAGLPIVASGAGGIPEALADAEYLVKPSDPQELCQMLTKMITNYFLYGIGYFETLTHKAQIRSALFSQQKMLEDTKKVYDSLLKK
jgi:glycosyltransferase involved in cell wall biosynthesis